MKHYNDTDFDTKWSILFLFIAIAFIVLITIIGNSISAPKWNNGICPKCEIRYELRAASHMTKYYACPICGEEVKRY